MFWEHEPIPQKAFILICQAVGIDKYENILEDYFSTIRTKMTDAEILKASLRDLGITVKTDADVRGFNGLTINCDIVAVLEGEYDIGWSRSSDGYFNMIANFWGVYKKHNQTQLINSIIQKYNVNKTIKKVKQRRSGNLSESINTKNKCPRCDSKQTIKYGYFQGKQNYKCQNCGTQFCES
ncbi:MAG: DUF1257 domain-containing protein [Symploca sp. SIO3C6]|uniref:DUF1257 domain-containing protein n=1 Tax=Symploca sp. SIO1C4 TaxID=2607765 RepID=A0A6B3N477_9CYAN|nr:DUF1257 domain-containing protein [Symploca sp. SIO3C6]NER26320.1 DUF1257 domain-containing protein [Symploca sp. SIO1C4]